jgi:hypothetical protein
VIGGASDDARRSAPHRPTPGRQAIIPLPRDRRVPRPPRSPTSLNDMKHPIPSRTGRYEQIGRGTITVSVRLPARNSADLRGVA